MSFLTAQANVANVGRPAKNQAVASSSAGGRESHRTYSENKPGASTGAVAKTGRGCYVCREKHQIYSCPVFEKMTVGARLDKLRALHHCFKCFQPNCSPGKCKLGACEKCGSQAHSVMTCGAPKLQVASAVVRPDKTRSESNN